jgi:regulator of sigma E protease
MTVLIFFVVLFVLILVHELGHFLAAKKFGIKVDEFGIGFPPKLFGFKPKGSETEYTFNLLPIGGFVKIFGEDPNEENTSGPERERSFVHKPKWQQAIVLVAGVTFNVLLAWVLLVSLFMVGMPTAISPDERDEVRNARLLVLNVVPDSPAANAGITPSHEVVGVVASDGAEPDDLTPDAIVSFVSDRGGEEITFMVRDDTGIRNLLVTPEAGLIESDPERAAVGISMSLAGIMRLAPHLAVVEGTKMTAGLLGAVAVGLGGFLWDAITFRADFTQVAGPVGIVGMVGEASTLGLAYLLTFTAFISLNLAVINMLPFPALDGGRLVFVAIEAVTKRTIKPVVANTLNMIGFVLLILLMIAVTYNDIIRLFG